jgi:hypothetical protein
VTKKKWAVDVAGEKALELGGLVSKIMVSDMELEDISALFIYWTYTVLVPSPPGIVQALLAA